MRAFGHVYTFVNTDLLFWRNIFYIAKALDNVRFVGFYTCSRNLVLYLFVRKNFAL